MIVHAQDLLKIALRAAELRGTREGDDLAKLFRETYCISENFNYDFRTNGELTLLRKLSSFGMLTVFDVGANFGEWAKLALNFFPEAHIHCCEPIPETFSRLAAGLSTESRVTLHNLAVADTAGELTFRHYSENPGQTSIFEYPSDFNHQTITCRAKRLDNIAAEHGVTQIDLLKIDVEGAEHLVLAGAEKLLAHGSIRVVQFEYGMININTKFLLRDFYSFFKAAGFKVGKIFPNTVDFSDYSLVMENFIGPNFVAVKETEPELIKALL